MLPPPFSNYYLDAAHDEMFDAEGEVRAQYLELYHRLLDMPAETLFQRQQAADLMFLNQGITFTVYGGEEGTERTWPYDLLPRIITSAEWTLIERGLTQRITALNLFLKDIYHEGRILCDGGYRVFLSTVVGTSGVRCVDCKCPTISTCLSSALISCDFLMATSWC